MSYSTTHPRHIETGLVPATIRAADLLYETQKELERYQARCKVLEERLAEIRKLSR